MVFETVVVGQSSGFVLFSSFFSFLVNMVSSILLPVPPPLLTSLPSYALWGVGGGRMIAICSCELHLSGLLTAGW